MKRSIQLFIALLLIAGLSVNAFGWGYATHTYIAKQLTPKGTTFDLNIAYAVTLPDMCNLVMSEEGQTLSVMMHQIVPARNPRLTDNEVQSLLYGIILHGEVYGADHTAHITATPPGHSPKADTGYFVMKGYQLAISGLGATVNDILLHATPSIDNEELATGIAVVLGHDLAETAVDLLVKENVDQTVGEVMQAAAYSRPEATQQLIATTYGQDIDFVTENETAWREQMIGYGYVMTRARDEAIAMLAPLQAVAAEQYLEAMLPQLLSIDGIDVTVTQDIVANAILAAIDVVKDDYLGELTRTIKFVKTSPISYHPIFAKKGLKKFDVPDLTLGAPEAFALEGNYPNPFNPATTIRYSLPEPSHVSLVVYNALGQQVAELVNGDFDAGFHSVQFNASGLASGIYFCRMQAGSFIATNKLVLAK